MVYALFFHFLDLAVHNAFILFSVNNEDKQITLKDFRLSVAIALIGTASPSPRGVKKDTKTSQYIQAKSVV